MRLIQLNTHRSNQAQDLLVATANKRHVDVVLVSEPNRRRVLRGNWKSDLEGDAALLQMSKSLITTKSGAGKGFVWVEFQDIVILSCYFSPNKPIEEFSLRLDELGSIIRNQTKEVIVAGDFNSKSPEWGGETLDNRGQLLTDWAASCNLYSLNTGDRPTFERGDYGSFLDVTFGSERTASRLRSWEVLDEESLSDHRYIMFEINSADLASQLEQKVATNRKWRIGGTGLERLHSAMQRHLGPLDITTPEQLVTAVKCACEEALPSSSRKGRNTVYWWTSEIGALRRTCNKVRRSLQRENRRTHGQAETRLRQELKHARNTLRRAIMHSKKKCWKALCNAIEEDPWGDAYKIVTKSFGRTPPALSVETVNNIVGSLFPTHEAVIYEDIHSRENSPFTLEDLEMAWRKMKTKKSAGPDGIPPEAVRIASETHPNKVLGVMNSALQSGIFPRNWKLARLVLLKKDGKPEGLPTSYRPLCLLDTFGKLFEHLLLRRLVHEVEEAGGLANNQYGFRAGHSTIDAIAEVMRLVDATAEGTRYTRRIPAVITLDIRNAFNSAAWELILQKLREFRVSPYLIKVIQSYLSERRIITEAEGTINEINVTSGVPQGSILGPMLWNILYDGVLRIPLPEGAKLIGYADDLALVVSAKYEQQLIERVEASVEEIARWLHNHRLQLAPEKTEAIVMAGRRTLHSIAFNVQGVIISPATSIKYLGVWLDHRRSFQEHIRQTAIKAARTTAGLTRLMANVGGPSASKRKLISSVVTSIILYGAPIWSRALEISKAREQLESVQRTLALRVCSAYRTVSKEAAFVIANMPPITLVAKQRAAVLPGTTKGEAKEELMRQWQVRWMNADTGSWTKQLIPHIKEWAERKHGSTNFYLTQYLSGHGCFNSYLFKVCIKETPKCSYCEEEDTPEHTILHCTRWEQVRQEYVDRTEPLTPSSMISKMLAEEEVWNKFSQMITAILSQKMREQMGNLI